MNRNFKNRIILGLFSIAFLLSSVGSDTAAFRAQDSLEERVDKLFSFLNETDSPGIAVLAVRDGKVLLRKGYGLANLEHRVPITPVTVFDIASISKQFCGMAISMLIEEGKISLEDDVRKYIPELPDFGQTITIDHLVHHISGIRDWGGTLGLSGWRMDDVISFEQILTMAFNQQGLNFKPGDEYTYSNTGYNLLAELVGRVTGKTFRQWTDENIFKPLGMKNTRFLDDHTEVIPNKAYGYSRSSDSKFSARLNGLTAIGSSSLYTTIDDLAQWVKNFDNPRVGGKAVLERMLIRGKLNSGRQTRYAFGLEIGTYRGLKTISHGGAWASFRTFLVHFPEQHFSVVTLLNFSPSNSTKAAYDVADIYLEDVLKPRPKSKPTGTAPKSVEVPVEVLDDYVGIYRLGKGWYVTITREGDNLMTQATAENKFPLTATSETRFWVEAYRAPIVFKKDKEGRTELFSYRGMTCPKLEDYMEPGPLQLAKLTGEYESVELKTTYTISVEDGKLVAKHRRHGTISLTYAYKDDFRGPWFMRSVEFFRSENGEVAGFNVTIGRCRNQLFTKKK